MWAQSFLPGVPDIIVGYRDDSGILKSIEHMKTMEIPRRVRGKQGMWDATVCLNFADAVLSWLRKMITVDDPDAVYTLKYEPATDEITLSKPQNGGSLVFVHDWYRN
ncbi:Dom-3 Z [Rhizophlyctis rosea]|nr:Dom-3 Z [Rhizophlyctis rosea]